MDLPEFSLMRGNNCLYWINTKGKVNDKSNDTFQVTVFVTDLEIDASACVFSSERYNPYPIRSVGSIYFLEEIVKEECPTLPKTTKYLEI